MLMLYHKKSYSISIHYTACTVNVTVGWFLYGALPGFSLTHLPIFNLQQYEILGAEAKQCRTFGAKIQVGEEVWGRHWSDER